MLPDADIDTVLNTLELLTGRSVLRPAALPTATYNLKISKPIPKSEAVLAIETVLALNGVGVAPQGDKFLIVTPLTLTRTTSPEMITGSAFEQPPSGKTATKIFQLDFLRVQEFQQMMAALQNPNYAGGTVLLPNANAIFVTDSVANLQRIEALLQQVDKPVMSGMKPKFYQLTSAKAADVVSKLRTILQGALAQQVGQATSYSADDRTNQVILVTDPRQYPFFDELIERLDTKSNPNTRTEVIPLKHADAQQVSTLLTTLISGQTAAAQRANAQALRPGAVNLQPNLPQAQPAVPNAPAAAPAVAAANLNLAGLEGSANEFSQLLVVQPDTRSNALVVFGTGDDIRLITGIIEKLDVVLAQVRIEVVLAEVNLDDKHSSGISQLGLVVTGDKLTGFSATEASSSITGGTVTYRGGTTVVSGPFDLAGTLTIGTTPRLTNSQILSQPAITTTHNKKAIFFFGETRPVVTGTTSTPTAAATTTGFSTSSQVQQQQIGTKVTVTPLIGTDGSVAMDINLDISDVTGTVQIDNNTQYVIGQRQVTSFNTARSGEILVIGGIQKNSDSKSTSRLGPIPIIGDIFGGRSKDKNRQELLIFIRPTVLTNTPADNATALEHVKGLPHKDDVMKTLDPTYQPPKPSLLDKVLKP